MINPKKEKRINWWNAPQYRNPINGLIGLVTVWLLVHIYDLSGFAVEYRTYFIWGAILVIGSVLIVRAFKYRVKL